MNRKNLLIIILAMIPAMVNAAFSDHFENASLRFNFCLYGNRSYQKATFASFAKQEQFSGNPDKILSDVDYGDYCIRVWDENMSELLYRKGFCNLFSEWRTIPEADSMENVSRQTQLLPYPKHKAVIELLERDKHSGKWIQMLKVNFNPEDIFIEMESSYPGVETRLICGSGDPSHAVDLTILAEGYTSHEREQFFEDVRPMVDSLFRAKPFDKLRDKFNVRAVFISSPESGPDIPSAGIWHRTPFNSTFDTFGTERYLTVPDGTEVWSVLSGIPTDEVYVLVNTTKYGGGGFYNYMAVGSARNERSATVFIHEFGHCFAGLADEYYESDTAYDGFYDLKVEPWEPNITTLVNFSSKWQDILPSGTPVPTPVSPEYTDKVGVFEGGGYSAKNIYRPFDMCRMRSNTAGFCPVCIRAIEKAVSYYCD